MKVMAWNIEGRLGQQTATGRGTPESILRRIADVDADIGVLTESYIGAPARGVDDRLEELGYQWHDIDYHDKGSSSEITSSMRIISRLGESAVHAVRWGDMRNMLVMDTVDPESQSSVRFMATHLSSESAANRLAQIDDIIPYVNQTDKPTVMLGDFNEMHGDDMRSQIVGSHVMSMIAEHVPGKLNKIMDMFIDMTQGEALARLCDETNLRDADPKHRCTETPKMRGLEWMPSVRMAQLDHMFISPDIEVSNFAIGRDGGSDHRDISADLRITE